MTGIVDRTTAHSLHIVTLCRERFSNRLCRVMAQWAIGYQVGAYLRVPGLASSHTMPLNYAMTTLFLYRVFSTYLRTTPLQRVIYMLHDCPCYVNPACYNRPLRPLCIFAPLFWR